MITDETSNSTPYRDQPLLFITEMHWGQQPVRLTARQIDRLPEDAPVTSVHIVPFYRGQVLVVKDRRGSYGFPGGRLDPGETREQAMNRELYEEANASVEPDYQLFAAIKIEYTVKLPGRQYPNLFSYLAMFVGKVRAIEPFTGDPAGVVLERAFLNQKECEYYLQEHDKILLREAIKKMKACQPNDIDLCSFLKPPLNRNVHHVR